MTFKPYLGKKKRNINDEETKLKNHIQAKLSDEYFYKLKLLSGKYNMSRSEMIRTILVEYIDEIID